MFIVGSFFEIEGIVAHDLARWERDIISGSPNSYVFWLSSRKAQHSSQELRVYLQAVHSITHKKKTLLEAAKEPAEFFDASLFLKAIPAIREHYGVEKIWATVNGKL